MKKLLLPCLLLPLLLSALRGQNAPRLNEVYRLGNNDVEMAFSSTIVTDSCYWVAGITMDTSRQPPYRQTGFLGQLAPNGTPNFFRFNDPPNYTHNFIYNSLTLANDGNFLLTGTILHDPGPMPYQAVLVKLDHLGDTIFTRRIFDPNNVTHFKGRDAVQATDSTYIMAIAEHTYALNGPSRASIRCFDEQGNTLWTIYRDTFPHIDAALGLQRIGPDRFLVVLSSIERYTGQAPFPNYARGGLMIVDALGQVHFEYYTEPGRLMGFASDCVYTANGEIVACGGIGRTVVVGGPVYNYYEKGLVRKIDSLGQVVWDYYFPYWGQLAAMVQGTADGGFVFAGHQQNEIDEDNDPVYPFEQARLGKLNADGQLLWSRYLYRLTTGLVPEPFHRVGDLDIAPDGDIVLTGWVDDWHWPPTGGLYGWLVRTDSFGCLVPGCELYDALPEAPLGAAPVGPVLRTYPNPLPAGAPLYVQVAYPDGPPTGPVTATLYAADGRALRVWTLPPHAAQYQLDLTDLPAGTYVLSLGIGERATASIVKW